MLLLIHFYYSAPHTSCPAAVGGQSIRFIWQYCWAGWIFVPAGHQSKYFPIMSPVCDSYQSETSHPVLAAIYCTRMCLFETLKMVLTPQTLFFFFLNVWIRKLCPRVLSTVTFSMSWLCKVSHSCSQYFHSAGKLSAHEAVLHGSCVLSLPLSISS